MRLEDFARCFWELVVVVGRGTGSLPRPSPMVLGMGIERSSSESGY